MTLPNPAAPSAASTAVEPETLTLQAADGTPIAALRYRPEGVAHAGLLVGSATAVPQGFYRRFAQHAAARGFEVLTLDYRGIGRSAPPSLRGYEVDYLDWGRQDLAAGVQALRQPGRPLYLVGHSYGGHALGLLPNHHEVHACWTFATGAGWHGWMPPLERLRVQLLWNVVGPLWTRSAGYLPWSRLGMGEDLPLGVYRQWRRWCSFPRYFFDDPALPHMGEQFAQLRLPIVAANATDDAWAPPASRDAFMQGYRNATVQAVTIDPVVDRTGPMGHMGYFRPQARALWDQCLDWLASAPQQAARPTMPPALRA